MTDQMSHFLRVNSIGYVQCSQYGDSGPLTLWVRCHEDTTALIISGDCHLASGFQGYGEVTMRTDDDKATTRSFEASTDNSALGLWTGGRSISVIQSMFGKERLVVRLTPFSMSPIEATFEIAGLEEAVKRHREENRETDRMSHLAMMFEFPTYIDNSRAKMRQVKDELDSL